MEGTAINGHLRSLKDSTVDADNEWSTLRSVIVGRAEHSCFPSEPRHMIAATMPDKHQHRFKPDNPFPPEILFQAGVELEGFCQLLKQEGVQVYRPDKVDWLRAHGYTGSMVRDALLVVGNTVIESCYTWQCRASEVELALGTILTKLSSNPAVRVVRAPPNLDPASIYAGVAVDTEKHTWAINNSRPAFDAADFMRFGKTLIGQLSHVTNQKGIQYVQDHVPSGYKVEVLQVTDEHAMHIDATILPVRDGLLIYNPERVSPESLRKHAVLRDWELVPYPFIQEIEDRERTPGGVPRFMTSAWLSINVLMLGNGRIVIEEQDHQFGSWLEAKGMTVFKLPFRNVNAIGGSFHCATVDLHRTSH